MKILVVYATRTGCTEDIARRIGGELRKLGGEVKVIPAASAPSPDGFDAVVAGSGVRAGKWHRAATAWVRKHAARIKSMPHAFFTVGLTMKYGQQKVPEVLKYTEPMIQELGLKPVGIGLFAGWFEPSKFPFMERLILKMMKAPVGDFRDFESIDDWVTAIGPRLGVEIPVGDSSFEHADAGQSGETLQVEM